MLSEEVFQAPTPPSTPLVASARAAADVTKAGVAAPRTGQRPLVRGLDQGRGAEHALACETTRWTHGSGRVLGLGPRLCCSSPGGGLAADVATMAGNQVAELGAVTGDTECYQPTGKTRSTVLL